MNNRTPVNKSASSRSFNAKSKTVKSANIAVPMRGGFRL